MYLYFLQAVILPPPSAAGHTDGCCGCARRRQIKSQPTVQGQNRIALQFSTAAKYFILEEIAILDLFVTLVSS